MTIVPRFLTGLIQPGQLPLGKEVWQETTLQMPLLKNDVLIWEDAITYQKLPANRLLNIGEILQYFPVALLTSLNE